MIDQDYLLEGRDHGWISPSGVYYPCSYGDHCMQAGKCHLPEDCRRLSLTETYAAKLEKLGWLRIQKARPVFPSHVPIGEPCPVTRQQLDTIERFLTFRGDSWGEEYRFVGIPRNPDDGFHLVAAKVDDGVDGIEG